MDPADRLCVALVGSTADLDAVRLVLLGAVAAPEVDQQTREACASVAAQLSEELHAAEDEEGEGEEGHGPSVATLAEGGQVQ